MQKCNWSKRIGLLFMTCCMLLYSMPIQAFAEETTEQSEIIKESIYIENIEDFVKFATQCRVDDYSKNRNVHLKVDLDLSSLISDNNFTGITSFSGRFYGENHTISGVCFTQGSEAIGLFRYIEAGALVCDLHVKGELSSTDSSNKIGGIVGINAGTIRNCSFDGNITGVGITGGIVGLNGTNGAVTNCEATGTINSMHTVGGIVGQNLGVITDCKNFATVNGDAQWLELESNDDTQVTVSSLWKDVQEEVADGSDIGGIAGLSDGIIASSENHGVIGYQHAGRNVGGIVGRQSGEVILCTNDGKISGKQDVGGIVGQFEPETSYEDVEELEDKVDELHDLMEKMIDDMEAMGDDLHADFQDLNTESSAAADTADALVDEMRYAIKKNVDAINELINRMDYAMNHFSVVMTYLNTALNTVDLILDDLDKVREDLNIKNQMEEDTYNQAKDKRLVLSAGIGGSLSTDNAVPEAGTQVTITIEEQQGYRLKQLTVTPYGKEKTDVTASVKEGQYSIEKMPEENVTIAAVFEYVGTRYLVQSNVGGKAELSQDQTKLKLLPSDGYKVECVSIESGENLYVEDVEVLELPQVKEGTIERIFVTFVKLPDAHSIDVVSGTGGTITVNPQRVMAGEKVEVTFTAITGYELDADSVVIQTKQGTPLEVEKGLTYTFTMPDEDVEVEATFKYNPMDTTKVYAVSNPGGTVSTVPNLTTGDSTVGIVCDNGYLVDHMVITDSATPTANEYVIPEEELTKSEAGGSYTYTLTTSTLTSPVKVEAVFVKKDKQYYGVNTNASQGGRVVADKASVTAGDTIQVAVANEPQYYLADLRIGDSENLALAVEDNTYEYTVPENISSEIQINASFIPLVLIARSDTTGGKFSYTVQGGDVIVTVVPDTGYTLSKITVLDQASGKEVLCQKEYADAQIYRFPASELQNGIGYADLQFQSLNNKETVEEAKDELGSQSDTMVDGINQISLTSDKIQKLLIDEYGNARNPEDLSQDEIDELSNLMLDLLEQVSNTSVAAGGMLGNTNTIIRVVGPYADESADKVDQDLSRMSTDTRAMNDSLKKAGKELQGITDYLNALEDIKATNLSGDFDRNSDRLKEQLDTISSLLGRLDDHAYVHSEQLEQDMRAVNDKMNEIFTLLIDKLDHMEGLVNGEDIIDDRSSDMEDTSPISKVTNCTNNASVKGDSNVGGIAGTMGREEADTKKTRTISVGNKYIARQMLSGCQNNGFITVKKENAGGIVGDLEVGYVHDCLGDGRVVSEDGNCIGGIAGTSKGTIEACSSSTVLSGHKYIGGIAGKANKITDSYAMVTVLAGEGWIGAIAGEDAVDDEDGEDITLIRSNLKERFHNNYYVSSTLYGINGVSYMGVAEPITYVQMLTKEKANSSFDHLTITFIDEEEEVIKQTVVPYGADLCAIEYPNVKSPSGDYMEWTGLSGDTMEGNLVLQTVTTSNVTILSSAQKNEKKSVALAEGVFTEEATISVEEYTGSLPAEVPVGSICHGYHVSLEQTDLKASDVTRIRLYNTEKGKLSVYRLNEAGWEKLDSKKLGSYVEVEMLGTEGIFCVAALDKSIDYVMVIGITVLCTLLLCGMVLYLRKQKRNKQKANSEEK